MSVAAAFAQAEPLLPPSGATVLVMVSGGADSVALLDLVYATRRWTVVVFHLDHALRPESANDAAFVATLARERALTLVSERVDIARIAKRLRLGIEDAARRERYRRAERAARRLHAQAILTAHHRDDQAETVLMHLLRGSGEAGLRGIAPRRAQGGVNLVRPLLAVTRTQLRAHLAKRGLAWSEDASNGDGRFRRNHLRARVLPLLEAAEPGFARALLALGAADVAAADAAAATALGALQAHGIAASRAGLRTLRALDAACVGAARTLGRWRIERTADGLAWHDCRAVAVLGAEVPIASQLHAPGSARRGLETITLTRAPVPADPRLPLGQAWMDLAALRWPLTWRSARADERWTPLGSRGTQRVLKSLADRKVGARERAHLGVLADADGVVWIPGLAIAERVRVSAQTRAALHGAVEPIPRLGGGGRGPAS